MKLHNNNNNNSNRVNHLWVVLAAAWTTATITNTNNGLVLVGAQQAFPPEARECFSAFKNLCGSSSSSSSSISSPTMAACGQCAVSNKDALAGAKCTQTILTGICKRFTDNGGGGGDYESCSAELDGLCPGLIGSCENCARSNGDALTEAGCTPGSIVDICTSREVPREQPENTLPTGATPSNPLRVFVQAGQSNCQGSASAEMMTNDPNPNYDELKGTQEGSWFAGFFGKHSNGAVPSNFYMGPMVAGEAATDGDRFGLEVSMGKRLYEADPSSPVLIVKYCWGGSNVATQWNPRTDENNWDREEDDGSAAYLLDQTVLTSKNHLYANMIYMVRTALETLEEGGVPYQLSGFFWMQGSADKKRTWKEYGDDLVALFGTMRKDLNEPTLPIVDSGGLHHSTKTGKTYAGSVLDGCNSVQVDYSGAAPNPDEEDCVVGPTDPCLDSTFVNSAVSEYFGYDPVVLNDPEFASLIPPGSTKKTFHWYKRFPSNLHAEYEGKILQGRMMANAYIQSFTTNGPLPVEWLLDDAYEQFPYEPCDPAVNDGRPSNDNICWMDQRGDADRAEATCGSYYSNNSSRFDKDISVLSTAESFYSGGHRASMAVLACVATWMSAMMML